MLQKEAAKASLGRSDRKSVAVGVCVNTGPLTQHEHTQMYACKGSHTGGCGVVTMCSSPSDFFRSSVKQELRPRR